MLTSRSATSSSRDRRLTVASVMYPSRGCRCSTKMGASPATAASGGDITERKLAEQALRGAQTELAHVNRVTTMGQLTASIAHEVNQPIAAAVINAYAALRWLRASPPDLVEVRQILGQIIESGRRAGDVIDRIRALIKKAPPTEAFSI